MSSTFRVPSHLAALVAMAALSACAPQVGPYEAQANAAATACSQGDRRACFEYQSIAPAAQAEAAQNQQNANVGTAVAAGVIGAAAGAAIVGATTSDRGYYNRPYYGRPYYRGGRYYR